MGVNGVIYSACSAVNWSFTCLVALLPRQIQVITHRPSCDSEAIMCTRNSNSKYSWQAIANRSRKTLDFFRILESLGTDSNISHLSNAILRPIRLRVSRTAARSNRRRDEGLRPPRNTLRNKFAKPMQNSPNRTYTAPKAALPRCSRST